MAEQCFSPSPSCGGGCASSALEAVLLAGWWRWVGSELLGRDGDDNLATSLVRAACVVGVAAPDTKEAFQGFLLVVEILGILPCPTPRAFGTAATPGTRHHWRALDRGPRQRTFGVDRHVGENPTLVLWCIRAYVIGRAVSGMFSDDKIWR
jgi:hypothetical protein